MTVPSLFRCPRVRRRGRFSETTVVGYDAAEPVLEANAERAAESGRENVSFERAVFPEFAPGRQFDVISCFFTLCYVDDVERALENLYDAVAPGGSLVFTYHNRYAKAIFEGIAASPEEHLDELNDELCEVLNDYIRVNRHDITDESGRLPLFTTMTRRLSRMTIRKSMNAMTRPYHVDDYCPHDREISECEATRFKNAASCPSSVSPHALRRSAITHHLNRDWPKEKVGERANVSVDVLDEHYDARTEQERRSTRKQYLENL